MLPPSLCSELSFSRVVEVDVVVVVEMEASGENESHAKVAKHSHVA